MAVALGGEMQSTAIRVQERMRMSLPASVEKAYKWERRSNLHVTLQFLGDTEESQVPRIEEALTRAARVGGGGGGAFTMTLGGLSWFKGRSGPRIILARLEGTDELVSLQQGVASALEPLGFEPERRPYHPHVTLARLRRKGKAPPQAVQQACAVHDHVVTGVKMEVDRVTIFQSNLTPAGALYAPLVTFALQP